MFHRQNCSTKVRRYFRAGVHTPFPTNLIVTGRHAFEWSLAIQSSKTNDITTYPNRQLCLAAFSKAKEKYQFGDIY